MGDSTYPAPLGDSNQLVRERGEGEVRPRSGGALAYRGEELAANLLARVFARLPIRIAVRLWSGPTFEVGAAPGADKAPSPRFVLCFCNPQAVCALVLGRDRLRLAEAHFRGDVDIEGDLFAALSLKDHLEALNLPLRERLNAVFLALKLRSLNRDSAPSDAAPGEAAPVHGRTVTAHSKDENRDAIRFHYDVSNEFYKLWLDRAMVYSCGYFERAEVSLDDAQQAKLEHICRKLLLRPGERFLDIGCGWGALVIHAAEHYGVLAHGITLSPKQLEVARQRIAAAGLQDRVTVELKDYRDLEGEGIYDKAASIGMFEHVGLKNLPGYFSRVNRLLKPGGLFLNHGITHEDRVWRRDISTEFINRYVFPDGQLDNISNIQRFMEEARFEISDVEGLRPHYALTLRAWVDRLERRRARALEYVNEATYRVWRLYMSACALEFESGHLGIYQVLAAKRSPGRHSCQIRWPLTRRHLYAEPAPRK
jgi:cyclopropane-fatty-acyl-phospholipid synthase